MAQEYKLSYTGREIEEKLEKIDRTIISPENAQVDQTIAVKSVDENGKPIEWEAVDFPQADWAQNDETAPDYVKNRTHYTTCRNETIFDQTFTSVNYAYLADGVLPLLEGETYTLVYDGETYVCTCVSFIYNEMPALGLGNFSLNGGEDTGEPFAIASVSWLNMYGLYVMENGTHTLTISGPVETVHPLPAKLMSPAVPFWVRILYEFTTDDVFTTEVSRSAVEAAIHAGQLVIAMAKGKTSLYARIYYMVSCESGGDLVFATLQPNYREFLTLTPDDADGYTITSSDALWGAK